MVSGARPEKNLKYITCRARGGKKNCTIYFLKKSFMTIKFVYLGPQILGGGGPPPGSASGAEIN